MFNPWKLAFVILAVMLVQTCSKPMESTDQQLSEMEKDLASLSVLSGDSKSKQDAILQGFAPGTATDEESKKTAETKEDAEKIPDSLLEDLKSSDANGHQTNLFDKFALQGFAPGTATDEESKKTAETNVLQGFAPGTATDEESKKTVETNVLQGFAPGRATDEESKKTAETNGVLLSKDDINEKQQQLFDILTRAESEGNSKKSELNSPEEEDKDKIPEDLLKELEAKIHEDQPKKPESTWLESNDKNDAVKKEILTGILMDEIVNEIKERNKRGKRIPDKVLDLLTKYNAKRTAQNFKNAV